jgi:ABC-type polysaccharide/polyol phosphate transport system ATPase subunit
VTANGPLWALSDVNFVVEPGERVGIVGRNGAGKSTLLKILSRITAPTRGTVRLRGRVGSLLEVGTGFHPELTGRDNVYLNGAIQGMSRRTLDARLDAIVAFAELAPFIDTPVKRYSSGMAMRLAFAVAAHLDAEILIVDEVLAVGDADFQRKCLAKMSDVAEQGRTVLFVSHNLRTVQALCPRALLLEDGRVVDDGPVDGVLAGYLSKATGIERWSSGDVTLRGAAASCTARDQRELRISLQIDVRTNVDYDDLYVDFGLENEAGVRLVQYVPAHLGTPATAVTAGDTCRLEIAFTVTALPPGEYTGTVLVHSRVRGPLLHVDQVPLLRTPGITDAPELTAAGFTACLVPRFDGGLRVLEGGKVNGADDDLSGRPLSAE